MRVNRLIAIALLPLLIFAACGPCAAVRSAHAFVVANVYPYLDTYHWPGPSDKLKYDKAKKAVESSYTAFDVACTTGHVDAAVVLAAAGAIADMLDLYGSIHGSAYDAAKPEWQEHRDKMREIERKAGGAK